MHFSLIKKGSFFFTIKSDIPGKSNILINALPQDQE